MRLAGMLEALVSILYNKVAFRLSYKSYDHGY